MRDPLKSLDIPDYHSPGVDADGRVTLRYFHPGAQAVWYQAEWNANAPAPLHRQESGIWSATSDPLPPDIYEYSLFVDGIPAADLRNPWGRHRFASLVQVTGLSPAAYDLQDVPHGATHVHWYHSSATGDTRRVHVYTPPGYELTSTRYPVLYLLHGSGDDDATWIETGRLPWMVDNLIAEGRALPMLVVMPYGHAGGKIWKEDRTKKIALFSQDLHECVLPLIEERYRTLPGAENRAMAGLSMGGGQTICAGLTRPDLFQDFGIFSAGVWPEVDPLLTSALGALRAAPPKVLWIGMGRRDFLYPRCTLLRERLAAAGVPFDYYEDESTHSWRAWRDYLPSLRAAALSRPVSQEFPGALTPEGQPLSVVGVYPLRTAAYDRALVISAMSLPHWILRQEGGFMLCVRPRDAAAAAEELARFELEGGARAPASPPVLPVVAHSSVSLHVSVWLLAGFFLAQTKLPARWQNGGVADSLAIRHGEVWRTVTALTLHADLSHLGANLAAGLVCAGFLLPIFGAGWTWMLILLTGALGNELNAWGPPDHLWLGASTAVFGALGLLVAAQCTERILARREILLREILLPLGAGLGLLGYLGVGDAQTDYTAHLFGMLCGLPLGICAVMCRAGERTPRWVQLSLAWLAPLLLAAAWGWAWASP